MPSDPNSGAFQGREQLHENFRIGVDPSTVWQPFGGKFKVHVYGKSPSFVGVHAYFSWPYKDDKDGSHCQESPSVRRLASDDADHLIYAVSVPRQDFYLWDPPTFGTLWAAICDMPGHNPYDGWSLVPRADLHLVGVGTTPDRSIDLGLPIGITSRIIAAVLAGAAALAIWIVLLIWTHYRKIRGCWAFRVITNRYGYVSLSQLQLATWTFVIGAGAIYVMALSGALIDIPEQALTLLGVAGLGGLGAQVASAQAANAAKSEPETDDLLPPPQNLIALEPAASNSIVLTWRAPANGPTPISYVVEQSADGGTSWAPVPAVTTPLAVVTGLQQDSEYQFRVSGVDSRSRKGTPSAPVLSRTTPQPPQGAAAAPPPPTTAIVTATALPVETRVVLTWRSPEAANPPAVTARYYIVQYREEETAAWQTMPEPVRGVVNATVYGLLPGTRYESGSHLSTTAVSAPGPPS